MYVQYVRMSPPLASLGSLASLTRLSALPRQLGQGSQLPPADAVAAISISV